MTKHTDSIDESKMLERIENDFNYHVSPPEARASYASLRQVALVFARVIVTKVPPGREQASALTRLEESLMHANAGIARQYPVEK